MARKSSYREIKKEVESLVKKACFSKKNIFGASVWDYHLKTVVKFSLRLGKKMKADAEVLELAALLHDYAGLIDKNLYEDHHKHGAEIAGNILKKLGYPEEKIDLIKTCILNHRGSVLKNNRRLKEARILASADAMSHFAEPVDMMYLTFGIHKYHTKEGASWLKAKLERSWKKIIPEGKAMIKEERKIILDILNKAIKK